jgi:hypothetical protein
MAVKSALHFKWAAATFAFSYIVVNVLAVALAIIVAAVMHANFSGNTADVHNPAFVVSERFYPLLNLTIWGFFAWMYFKKPAGVLPPRKEGLYLGILWLAMALPCDVVFFIIIKSEYSLSPYDFFVGQMPWIYFVYCAVLISPAFYLYLFQKRPGN